MSAEKSQAWLIDALYEERDEQEPSTTSGESLDARQRAELASYGALLEQLRPELVSHSPRPQVSASILEAARKQAEVYATQDAAAAARPARRAPGVPSDHTQSFWSRASTRGVVQLVAGLAICLGAGLLIKTMGSTSHEAAFAPTSSAPVAAEQLAYGDAPEEVALMEEAPAAEPAMPVEAAKPAAPELPLQKQELALRDKADDDGEAQGWDGLSRSTSLERGRRATTRSVAKKSAPAREKSVESKRGYEVRMEDALDESSIADLSSKGSAPQRNASSTNSFDSLFGGKEGPAAKRDEKPRVAANTMPSDDDYVTAEAEAAPRPAMEPAPSAPMKTATKSSSIGGAPGASAGAATAAEGASKEAAADSEEAEDRGPITLAEAERALARSDYEQAVRDADAYLGRNIGTNRERGRAMELKAQALEQLGRTAEARQLYDQIRQKYPDYYAKEKLEDKKRSKAKAPSRKSYDFNDESMESPSNSSQSY